MPNENNQPDDPNLETRVSAIESSLGRLHLLFEEVPKAVAAGVDRIESVVRAGMNRNAVVPPAPGAGARPDPKASKGNDAWGRPLDGKGNVVQQPPGKPPAPPSAKGEAPACSCSEHEPNHQPPGGCSVKGCSCSLTS